MEEEFVPNLYERGALLLIRDNPGTYKDQKEMIEALRIDGIERQKNIEPKTSHSKGDIGLKNAMNAIAKLVQYDLITGVVRHLGENTSSYSLGPIRLTEKGLKALE